MVRNQERKPLVSESIATLRFEDFCLNTGLDRDVAADLMRTGRLRGTWSSATEPRRPVSVFMDDLPSREALVAMGLPVRDDYDPGAPRYGGIECRTHGWAESVLVMRYDVDLHRDVPDHSLCWECSRAGVPPDSGNSTRHSPDWVTRWVQTQDELGRS
ncbi:MAG: hypothetical protein JWO76_22 [Nocardioides sp.]|nr:hypothetical protein [Nocardioides sp.]